MFKMDNGILHRFKEIALVSTAAAEVQDGLLLYDRGCSYCSSSCSGRCDGSCRVIAKEPASEIVQVVVKKPKGVAVKLCTVI